VVLHVMLNRVGVENVTMAGLKFVSVNVGVQFVMTSGKTRMLASHVDSLVSLCMVRNPYS
jgi:hypothetical protein